MYVLTLIEQFKFNRINKTYNTLIHRMEIQYPEPSELKQLQAYKDLFQEYNPECTKHKKTNKDPHTIARKLNGQITSFRLKFNTLSTTRKQLNDRLRNLQNDLHDYYQRSEI